MNSDIIFPTPVLIRRPIDTVIYDKCREQGLSEIQSNVISSRCADLDYLDVDPRHHILNPTVDLIPDPLLLSNMDKAAKRIADYLLTDTRPIVLSVDFDVDGISSAAILMSILADGGILDINNNTVIPIISNRLNDGYGFTDNVVDSILKMKELPGLVMTADHGSSNESQIYRLVEESNKRGNQIDVIVTDHHSIPEGGGPQSAYSFINPNQGGDQYPDKTICGATVAYLTMQATLDELVSRKVLDSNASIEDKLDYATTATVADCVSIASPLNRYIINNGLRRMNDSERPAWIALKDTLNLGAKGVIDSSTIGFQLGPKINANSRMGYDGQYALDFLLSKTVYDAKQNLASLNANNEDRKSVERDMLVGALKDASRQYMDGVSGIFIYMEDGLHSVHGIVASRVVEKYGCVTACVSHKDENILSSSLRSIDGVNIKSVLDEIQEETNVFLGYGGHSMAAGCSFKLKDLGKVRELLNSKVEKILNYVQPKPIIYIDNEPSELVDDYLSIDGLDSVTSINPYGREFDYPVLSTECQIKDVSYFGKKSEHLRLKVQVNNAFYEAIWFKFPKKIILNDSYQMVFSVEENHYTRFGEGRRLQFNVVNLLVMSK